MKNILKHGLGEEGIVIDCLKRVPDRGKGQIFIRRLIHNRRNEVIDLSLVVTGEGKLHSVYNFYC